MALKLAIVTPDSPGVEIECDEAIAPGVNGELGLLSQHVPMVSALAPGVLTVIANGKRDYYVVGTGFVEMDDDTVSILTSTCEAASNVDVARAKQALSTANEKLSSLGPDEPGYHKAALKVQRAQARLDGAARIN
jgi:F-type H+-transporting ATPase subunit epsilon